MVDFVDSDRGDADGCGYFVAEDGRCGVADVCIDELTGDYAVAVEGLTVC